MTGNVKVQGYPKPAPNPINESRVRIIEVIGSTLFSGWGVKL